MSSFTVFIPRVFANIREDRIIKVFHDLDIGNVGKVDLVKRTNKQGKSFNMAFIHFDELYQNEPANEFHRDILEDKKSKVVYEDPWFWLVLPFEEKEQNSTTPQLNTPQLNIPQLNISAQEFVPYSLGQGTMMMTAQGPMWYPAVNYMAPPPPVLSMVPPQVAYGNRSSKQKPHPKKRINVPIAPCLSSNTPTPGETPTADNVLMDLVEKTKPTRSSEDQGVTLDYGEIKVPNRRKRVKTMDTKPKASLINPSDLEEGEE